MNKPLYHNITVILLALVGVWGITSCATSNLDDGEQLYTGLKKIDYHGYEACDQQTLTQEELEAALATAPNGALFGSSYYRTPFPYGLWIWNACNGSKNVIAKWLNNSFGKSPVLMSNVNPALRASVANNVLQNHGYFHGDVTYDILEGKPKTTKRDTTLLPRTAKIQYHVNFGPLFTIDSISYSNYPDTILHMITDDNTLLHTGDAFDVSTLDSERNRIYQLLRNHGYYYFEPSYTSYFADTLHVPGKVQLQLHMTDSLPDYAMKKWVIGSTTVQVKRQMMEQITDSTQYRYLKVRFGGKKPPLRTRVVLRDLKLRPGDVFSQDAYQESLNNLATMGIFSASDITFTPRYKNDTLVTVPDTIGAKNGDTRAGAGVMDMEVNAILDKPYDFTLQATVKGKTNSRVGPGLSVSLNKRNAFGGGELLSLTLGANYEFQAGGDINVGNSYDFSASFALTMPRLWLPNFITKKWHQHWYTTPSTILNVSAETIRRAGYYNRNVLGAEFNYIFQPSATSIHEISPLVVTYGRTSGMTDAYTEKISKSMYTYMAAQDELTLRIRYKYRYTSPQNYRHPIFLEATFTEAGNILGLLNMAFTGQKWNTKGKTFLGTGFSQFLKFDADFSKKWTLKDKSYIVAHFNGGLMLPLGNSTTGPFSEQYYIGGANDLRGFSMRSLGPGGLHVDNNQLGYVYHNGTLKLVFNLEYRPHLFGSLYGAVFLDAGNVWCLDSERLSTLKEVEDELGNPKKIDLGLDAGFGLRYDLDYFVLRLDWGFAFHKPYDTGASGFFNINSFKSAQCINFAIGYPF